MAKDCPIVGECYFVENCESDDQTSIDELLCDNDIKLLSAAVGEQALRELVEHMYKAWNSAGCLRERIISLRLLAIDQEVPSQTRNLANLVAEEVHQAHFGEANGS